jgi:hypothetical protein
MISEISSVAIFTWARPTTTARSVVAMPRSLGPRIDLQQHAEGEVTRSPWGPSA